MTHQRLNIGVYLNNTQNMQRKPIANKYRKGTMKSTLYSTYILFTESVSAYTVIHKYTSSTGSERESEIALQIIRRLHIIIHSTHTTHSCMMIYICDTHIYSAKYNRTECLCVIVFRYIDDSGLLCDIYTTLYVLLYTTYISLRPIYVISLRDTTIRLEYC
jgi:hypothetical protein